MVGSFLGVRKGAWTEEEDILLRKCIEAYGEGTWHLVPSRAGVNRCRKSCRLRWLNYLKPNIRRGDFGEDEVDLIIRLHKLLGNRWSLIAGRLPGRTANDVKNYWNTHVLKKLNTYNSNTDLKPKPLQIPSKPKTDVIKPRPRTLSMKSFPAQSHGNNLAAATPASNDNLVLANSFSYSLPNENDEIMWWENLLMNINEVDNDQQEGSLNNSTLLSGLEYQAINEESGDRRTMVVDEDNYGSWSELFCNVDVCNVTQPNNYL